MIIKIRNTNTAGELRSPSSEEELKQKNLFVIEGDASSKDSMENNNKEILKEKAQLRSLKNSIPFAQYYVRKRPRTTGILRLLVKLLISNIIRAIGSPTSSPPAIIPISNTPRGFMPSVLTLTIFKMTGALGFSFLRRYCLQIIPPFQCLIKKPPLLFCIYCSFYPSQWVA